MYPLSRFTTPLMLATLLGVSAVSFHSASALAQAEASKRYLVTHAAGDGPLADKAAKRLAQFSRRLNRRNVLTVEATDKQLAKLRRHPLFSGSVIEEDARRYLLADNSSETMPYGIAMVGADPGAGLAPGSAATKVCIIDSGYEMSHPDLPGPDRVSGVSQTGDAWNAPGDSHGTHVAGTIAALGDNGRGVRGVHTGENLSLYIVKVFDDSGGWTRSSDLIDALDSCVANGADIVSMSLGGSYESSVEAQAFADALANGVLSVAAAGNSGNTAESFPASHDAVMSVAAIDSAKNLASFSQRNAQVEVSAPGVGVDSTVTGGGYARYSGTSMATPHVAGVAALVKSNHPECTATQLRRALVLAAEDLGIAGRDASYGFGLVNAATTSEVINQYGCDNLPAEPGPPEPEELSSGDVISGLAAPQNEGYAYKVVLPEGATDLDVRISGGSGDADLYVRAGQVPTLSEYDCRPWLNGNTEQCFTAAPESGTHYISVIAYSSFSNVSLSVTWESNVVGPPVNEAPVASIDASTTSGKAPLTVSFDASGSTDDNGITEYLWDFGDGGSSSGLSVTHTYTAAGDYDAVLSVSDGELSDSAAVTITVLPENRPPVASFSLTPSVNIDTSTDVSAVGSATDPDGDSVSFSWNFGDGTTKSGQSVSHRYGAAGNYTITLVATDSDGAEDTVTDTVSVEESVAPPPPSVSLNVTLNRRGTTARLRWSAGEISTNRVRVFRNGDYIQRTRNDGAWNDKQYSAGDSYVVCDDTLDVCSDPASP